MLNTDRGRRIINHCAGLQGLQISSDSGSSSSQSTIDQRTATQNGDAVSASGRGTVNITKTDNGAVAAALDTIKGSAVANGDAYEQLLKSTESLFAQNRQIFDRSQQTAVDSMAQLQAAANDRSGVLSEKTVILIALASAAAYAYVKGAK